MRWGNVKRAEEGALFFFSATIFPYLRFSAYMLALLCVWCAVGLAPLRPGAGSGAWRVVHRPAVRHSATTLSELETDDAGKSHPLCRAERSQLIRQLSVAAAAVLLQRVCTATARLHRCCAPAPLLRASTERSVRSFCRRHRRAEAAQCRASRA